MSKLITRTFICWIKKIYLKVIIVLPATISPFPHAKPLVLPELFKVAQELITKPTRQTHTFFKRCIGVIGKHYVLTETPKTYCRKRKAMCQKYKNSPRLLLRLFVEAHDRDLEISWPCLLFFGARVALSTKKTLISINWYKRD